MHSRACPTRPVGVGARDMGECLRLHHGRPLKRQFRAGIGKEVGVEVGQLLAQAGLGVLVVVQVDLDLAQTHAADIDQLVEVLGRYANTVVDKTQVHYALFPGKSRMAQVAS